MSVTYIKGNIAKCSDCKWFEKSNDPKATRFDDGICNLYFPRGYVSRKPPHKVWSGQNHCFQFEVKDSFEQTQMDIQEE